MSTDVAGICARVPFLRFLGFEVTAIDALGCEARMPFADRHIGNPVQNYYHGGIVASYMEAVASLSIASEWERAPPKPINLTIDYLRPARAEDLFARASVTRKGRRMASVQAFVWQDDVDRPAAKGLFHFLLV